MHAQRNRPASVIARDEAILDAVSAGLSRYGPRKLTAQDVADASGISRMTLYRAMGSMDNAILLALSREFSRAVARIRASLPNTDGATRLALFLGRGAQAFIESELVTSVLKHQPELIEPYLSARLGRSQEVVLAAIEALLDEGRADGSVQENAPSALTLLLLVRGVSLGAPLTDSPTEFAQSCSELTNIVAAALGAAPVPVPGVASPALPADPVAASATDTHT